MPGSMVLHLPFPVSTNMLYTNVRHRGRVPTKRYLTWRAVADADIATQNRNPRRSFTGPVRIDVKLGAPNKIRRDGDNYLKCVLDTIKRAGIIVDDSSEWVRAGSFEWANVKGAIVTISEVPGAEVD